MAYYSCSTETQYVGPLAPAAAAAERMHKSAGMTCLHKAGTRQDVEN